MVGIEQLGERERKMEYCVFVAPTWKDSAGV